MQGSATAPAVSASPAAPPAPPPATGQAATEVSPNALRQLLARRSEISSQLSNVRSRRDDLAGQLRNAAPGVDRAGLETQVASLNQRVLELENELNVTGRELIAMRGALATTEQPSGPVTSMPDNNQMTAIAIVFTIAVLMPLSIAWARAIFRRARHATERPGPDLTQRLDRMEEGIEAIAIEVERISENQRFVTKMLGEGAAPMPGARRADAVAVDRGAAADRG